MPKDPECRCFVEWDAPADFGAFIVHCQKHSSVNQLIEAAKKAEVFVSWFREMVMKGDIVVGDRAYGYRPFGDYDVVYSLRKALEQSKAPNFLQESGTNAE